jgi:hypothetical protein
MIVTGQEVGLGRTVAFGYGRFRALTVRAELVGKVCNGSI